MCSAGVIQAFRRQDRQHPVRRIVFLELIESGVQGSRNPKLRWGGLQVNLSFRGRLGSGGEDFLEFGVLTGPVNNELNFAVIENLWHNFSLIESPIIQNPTGAFASFIKHPWVTNGSSP